MLETCCIKIATALSGDVMSAFLIDARFLLRNTTEAYLGAPLIVVDGKDNTFCFGFLRELLRIRNCMHISTGAVVFGTDALLFATKQNIHSTVDMCLEFGVAVIYDLMLPALAVVAKYADRFANIVTDDQRILYFCSEMRAIHLVNDLSSIERMMPDSVQRRLGVPIQHVPTYLALTEGSKCGRASSNGSQPAVTTREARRLVELYGSLPVIYLNLPTMKSPSLVKKLADNQKIFNKRYHDNTASPSDAPTEFIELIEWKFAGSEKELFLRERGFYSLIRMLPLAELPVRSLRTNHRVRSSKTYLAVLNSRDFNDMLERIALSKVCAIDTEADDKDPRTANLFGISFALAPGDAFFVPFCERDMGDLTQNIVRSGLRKLFAERIRFVGHNLNYDFMLLYRNEIEPPTVWFDTLLAAHECYGDLDFFNLSFLAHRLLGQKIKPYKDIVPRGKTFLELPFEEMMEHACTDADVALQLHTFLECELKDRKIEQQFETRTIPLALALLNLENDGIPLDGHKLELLRCRIVNDMLELNSRVSDGIGGEIDLDSQEEVSIIMNETLGLLGVIGRNSLTRPSLEQLASRRPLLKLIVEYKRSGRRLKRIESIIKSIRRGRVYPLLNQIRMGDGRISSTDPDLFADDGLDGLRECVGGESAAWFQDRRRSLDLAQWLSGDLELKKDRTGPGNVNLFMAGQPSMVGVNHDELLLRVLIGESSHRLSTRFLVDRPAINNIVHALSTRVLNSFWLSR